MQDFTTLNQCWHVDNAEKQQGTSKDHKKTATDKLRKKFKNHKSEII